MRSMLLWCAPQLGLPDGQRGSRPTKPVELIMRGYLGGDGADPKTMMARANALQCVLDDWFRQVSLA